MFTNREGFNIDAVCRSVSHVVNNRTALVTALGLSLQPLLSKWAPGLLQQLLNNEFAAKFLHFTEEHAGLRRPAWIVALLTSAYAINSWLTLKTTNNWVEDKTWDFNREIVLITGGSSGIGAATAQEFLRRNKRTKIVIVDLGEPTWKAPAGTSVHFFKCDLTDAAAVKTMADRVRAEVGHPTVVFNNAGVARGAPILCSSPENFELVIKTNLLAQYYVTQQFLGNMVRHDHGHIVYSGSLSSIIPPPTIGPYGSTKAGLTAMHDVCFYLSNAIMSCFIYNKMAALYENAKFRLLTVLLPSGSPDGAQVHVRCAARSSDSRRLRLHSHTNGRYDARRLLFGSFP